MKTTRTRSLAIAFALAAAVAAGGPLEFAIRESDLDTEACATFMDGKPTKPDHEMMLNALGLSETRAQYHRWHAAAVHYRDLEPHVFHYRIAFKKAASVGSILFTTGGAAWLKADAPYPGDPQNPEHWQPLQHPPRQPNPYLVTLPPGFSTRAFLFTHKPSRGGSWLSPVRIFSKRLLNLAGTAYARASSEYQAPDNFGGALYAADRLVRAQGAWISAGKNRDGNITTPHVTDLDPAWLAISWDAPKTFDALYLTDNFTRIRFDTYRGPENASPLLAMEREWKAHDPESYSLVEKNGRWVEFAEPVTTRGFRIYTDKVVDQHGKRLQAAEIESLLVLADLGDAPIPEMDISGPRPPPFGIPYELEQDGLVTMALDDADGFRVRNLMARIRTGAGAQVAAWDLLDDHGAYIQPGTYRWKAITHPELRLRYEFSVYPNVSQHHPTNSAWLNGPSGPGGWLADHSPPYGVCAGGDHVFVGARVPEAGIGFAACDVSGRKLWGIHAFGPFGGARRMATDGKTVFVENMGIAYDDVAVEHVWGVDIATQKVRDIVDRKDNERRRTGVVGIAAADSRLYLAIRAKDRWLMNATGEDAVDVNACVPRYQEQRKPKRPYEIVPNPRDDFLRLFRLKGAPPGYAEGHGLTYLESTRGPGYRQQIVLAFNKPVSIGSCVFPVPQTDTYRVQLSVLKPDAPYPPDAGDKTQWVPFEKQAVLPWDVALAPTGLATRALLITFSQGQGDELDALLFDAPADDNDDLFGSEDSGGGNVLGGSRTAWTGRLEGMKLLLRRYKNLYETATVSVSSGAVDRDGVWIAERTTPLSPEDPECFVMEWETPQTVRGLAIKEIDCKLTEVDVWTGPAGSTVDMAAETHWENVGRYVPRRRMQHQGFGGHNALARYMDGTVDFGRDVSTRAVRLRVVEQWLVPTREGSCAKDELGLDPARCRLFGVAPLEYLGGEEAVDPLTVERLEVYDTTLPAGKLLHEFHMPAAGGLAVGPGGALFAFCSNEVVAVDLADGTRRAIIEDLQKPVSMAIDSHGHFYIFDAGESRKIIRVYDPDGSFLRVIGTPGGYQVGPWDPNRFQNVTGLAIDRDDKLWAVDSTYWPKRTSVWRTDGTFLREYLGPTQYGGAGVLDPWDKTRLMYGPLEFELDWKTGTSRLKSLTWDPADGWSAGEQPIHLNGHIYMVNTIESAANRMPVAGVFIYENGRLRRAAAMGLADKWKPLKAPGMREKLGTRLLTKLQFLWIDRNEDGDVQFEEIELEDRVITGFTPFNDDLGVQAGPYRYEVQEFLPTGVPVYGKTKLPLKATGRYMTGEFYRLDSGNFYEMGGNPEDPESWHAPDGTRLWTYPTHGRGVGPNRTAGGWKPGQVVSEFGICGHVTAAGGDLGEAIAVHNNMGQFNLWTADGLLAGWIFRENRDPTRRYWQMREHERGMVMDDVTLLEEHFHGWFCQTKEDGKYYAIGGKNHASIVEVIGMDEFTRLSGSLEICADDIKATREWARQTANTRAKERINSIDCYRAGTPVGIDGAIGEWDRVPGVSIDEGVTFKVTHDDEYLYLLYSAPRGGRFRNTGNQWDRLFKSGSCVDFLIGTDTSADPDRRAPVASDKRVLITMAGGKPQVILYDMVVPGTPREKRWRVASPVGETEVDVVRRIETAKLAVSVVWADLPYCTVHGGYNIEVAVPLTELGLKIERGLRLKMDSGVLYGDREGGTTVRRAYWANSLSLTVADLPSEARVMPDMWGWIRFMDRAKGPTLDAPDMMFGEKDEVVEDLLGDLEFE